MAVADSDERIVRAALNAALEGGCPREAIPMLTERLNERSLDGMMAVLAIRVIAPIRLPVVLDVLVKAVISKKRRWFFGRKLAPKSQPMLAALAALANTWSKDPIAHEGARARGARHGSGGAECAARAARMSGGVSSPVKFLSSLAQSLSTMMLYPREHPTWARAVDGSFQHLVELQTENPNPQFSFIGTDVIYGQTPMHDMKDWPWAEKLAGVGVQRLEFSAGVSREEYEEFLADVLTRIVQSGAGGGVANRCVAHVEAQQHQVRRGDGAGGG